MSIRQRRLDKGWGSWLAFKAYDVFEASGLLGGGGEKQQLETRLGRNVK